MREDVLQTEKRLCFTNRKEVMFYKQKRGYVLQAEKRLCFTNRKEVMFYKQKRAKIEKGTKMDIEAEIKSCVRIEEMQHSKVRKEIDGRY